MEDEKEGYYCYLCDYRTTKNTDWLKHLNTKKHQRNGKGKSTICNICNFSTSTHWNLKLHILSHHSTKEEREKHKYYCGICDLVFFCSTYMNKHTTGKIHKNKELCIQFQKELDEKQKLETIIN
jgi:hypothetical protein